MSKKKHDPCPRCGGVLKLKKGAHWVVCGKGCGFTVSRSHRFSATYSKGEQKDRKKQARKAAKKNDTDK